jgi:ABC-2 type transport system permease protein
MRDGGMRAALRAELLVMRHRPAVLALVLTLPVNMLISSYLTDYVSYLTAGKGTVGDGFGSGVEVLPALLPGHYLTGALSGFGTYSGVYGPAVLFLLGALIAGTDWGRGTIKTALLQGPGRLQTRFGQDLAVMLAAAVAVVLTFLLAAAASAAIGLKLGGSAFPQASSFPVPAHVAAAVAGALLLALACTAIGLALGTVLHSATKAAAVVLLWAVVVQPNLDDISAQLHGVLLKVYEVLPDASINTIVNLYNTATTFVPGTTVAPPNGAQVTPGLAFGILGLYLLAFLAITAVLTRRRSIS